MLQWTGLWRHPVIGFNAAGYMYYNHPYSFSSNSNNIACLSSDQSNYTHIIFKISSEPNSVQLRQQSCWRWYFRDIGFYGPVKHYVRYSPPCPCTLFQARYDLRWELYLFRSNSVCYLHRFPAPRDVGQLCCYLLPDGEAILQGAGSGGFLLFYPASYSQFDLIEYQPKLLCCPESVGLCHIFSQRRPLQTCDNYEIQMSGKNLTYTVYYVTRFAKMGLPHIFNFLEDHNVIKRHMELKIFLAIKLCWCFL